MRYKPTIDLKIRHCNNVLHFLFLLQVLSEDDVNGANSFWFAHRMNKLQQERKKAFMRKVR